MRGIATIALLGLAVGLGGCNFRTEGNVFSTATGDVLPISGQLVCQMFAEDGKPDGVLQLAHLISLKNGPNQQYLWINEPWLQQPKELVPFTAQRVSPDRFMLVSQDNPEPGQSVYSLRATKETFEIRVYDKDRVEAVAKNFRVRVTAGDYHSYSIKGDQQSQGAFLRELNRTSEGVHLIFGCARAEKPVAPKEND